MFWYIGGILAGFAIGYVISIYQNRDQNKNGGAHKRGKNNCMNCKNMEYVTNSGIVRCREEKMFLIDMPKACSRYKKIEESEDEWRGGSR